MTWKPDNKMTARQIEKELNKIAVQFEEKIKTGDILLSIQIGEIRITESQFVRLQKIGVVLNKEQVTFFEKAPVYVKK